jgi:chromosome segregation ATPase
LQLRKLEIAGFKSFMSRIELDFSGGVTAIRLVREVQRGD